MNAKSGQFATIELVPRAMNPPAKLGLMGGLGISTDGHR
jgi:hypothetical protein